MKKEPKHCVFALSHLNQHAADNKVSACYRCIEELGNYNYNKMSEIMNNDAARKHRMTLQSGEWPEGCGSCKDFEEQGTTSTRLGGLVRYSIDEVLKDYNKETGEINKLRFIELRFGNECNLACRHCNTVHSSRWEAIVRNDPTVLKRIHRKPEQHGFKFADGFYEDIIENIAPGLEEIMFSGGETLYQKKHYEFINSIPEEHAKHITLFYVTNGTIRTLDRYDLLSIWKKFKKIKILVSTDGVGERFEYFRHGAKWNDVEGNMKYWQEKGITVHSEFTISAYQMFYLRETIDYLYDNQIGLSINPSMVQYPPVINARIIPTNIKEKIENEFKQYLQTIKDPVKYEHAKRIGDYAITYMKGDNQNVYSENSEEIIPTWKEFEEQALAMDEIFKTDIKKSFPKIAETFSKQENHD